MRWYTLGVFAALTLAVVRSVPVDTGPQRRTTDRMDRADKLIVTAAIVLGTAGVTVVALALR